jgi:hypothetical protein
MPSRMYSTIQLLEIMRRSAFKSPLSYPSLLGRYTPPFHLYPYMFSVD